MNLYRSVPVYIAASTSQSTSACWEDIPTLGLPSLPSEPNIWICTKQAASQYFNNFADHIASLTKGRFSKESIHIWPDINQIWNYVRHVQNKSRARPVQTWWASSVPRRSMVKSSASCTIFHGMPRFDFQFHCKLHGMTQDDFNTRA